MSIPIICCSQEVTNSETYLNLDSMIEQFCKMQKKILHERPALGSRKEIFSKQLSA